MRITIELEDKLGERIKQFCKLNKLTYTEYLSKMIEKQFALDMFGDLNDKIQKKPEPILKPVEHVDEQPKVVEEKPVVQMVENIVEDKQEEVKEIKKTKRQLKVK